MPSVGGREGIHYPLYDSVTTEAGDVELTLFQQPIGQAGKTLYDTNMRLAGQLQAPETFDVFAICAGSVPGARKEHILPLMKGTLELKVGNKCYYEIPIFWLTAAGGLNAQVGIMGTLAGATPYANFGVPHGRNMHCLRHPVRISSGESFRVELTWLAAPGVSLMIWVRLEGILKRAIQ